MANSCDHELLRELEDLGIPFSVDAAELARASSDFGGIARGNSWAVTRPRTVEHLRELLRWSGRHGVPLTARGRGTSQSGQSVADGGVTVEFAALSEVGEIDVETRTLQAQAGASFRDVVEACRGTGLLPPVLPLNLDLSIGGVLSAGGFGSSSHRGGLVVSHLREVGIITAEAELSTARRDHCRGLYDAVLGGVGQAGFIHSACLELEPVPAAFRTETLAYADLDSCLDDLQSLARRPEVFHLEAFCSSTFRGLRRGPGGRRVPLSTWSYGVQVTTPATADSDTFCRAGELRFSQHLHVEDDEPYDFASRYDVRFAAMRATGAWEQCHPWFEVILPLAAARGLIPEILSQLPPFFGDGHRLLLFAETDRPRSCVFPEGQPVLGFAVLPTGIPSIYRDAALAVLEKVDDTCRRQGGVRYRSGYLFGRQNTPSLPTSHGAALFSSCLARR